MRGIWIMAGVAFREAARKRFLWMALGAGALFLGLFGAGLHFQAKDFATRAPSELMRRQASNFLLMMGLYAVDALAVMMAVLTSVDTLSGEIVSGAIQAVVTKPIRRWQLLLGKWLGFTSMLTGFIVLMVLGAAALAYVINGGTVHNLGHGLALIWLEGVLLLTVTLFFGTTFSTLTNGVLTLGLHGVAFLGGWIEVAGQASSSPSAVNVGIVASLFMPSETLWRRAAYEMQSPLVNAIGVSPFTTASTPSMPMVGYAVVYLLVFLGAAIYRFEKRDL